MLRYEEGDDQVIKAFFDVIETEFPEYQSLTIKVLYDNKKRVKAGALILASIETPGEKLKFFSADNIAVDGYDYILIMDKKSFELGTEQEIKNLICHELQHIDIDDEGKCKLRGHEVEDFHAEIERNVDNPRWKDNLGDKVATAYEDEKGK